MPQSELSRKFIDIIPRSMLSIRTEMRSAARSEFTVPQFRVMAQLSYQTRTNGELAEVIGISVPAMSRLVDSLTRKGIVKRIQSTNDRRQNLLTLSGAGKRKYAALRKATQDQFTRRFDHLTLDQQRALQEGLRILSEIFQ